MHIDINITKHEFSHAKCVEEFAHFHQDSGAIVNFLGKVRQLDYDIQLKTLYIEHFPNVTEAAIQQIIEKAAKKWAIQAISVRHRIGSLKPQDNIVLIQVASKHRLDAFLACEFVMDYLKTEAPFWKKETFTDESSNWVEAKASDTQQKEKWMHHE